MKHVAATFLLGVVSTTAQAQTQSEVDPSRSPALAAIVALDGAEKAEVFAKATGKQKGFVPPAALAATLAAIRATELGEEGQEFNMLFSEGNNGRPTSSSYEHQLKRITGFVNLTYMLWLSPKNPKKPKDPTDWDEYLQHLGDCYNNKMLWNSLRGQGKARRVGPFRSYKQRHKWTESVRAFFAEYTDPADHMRLMVEGLDDGRHTLTCQGRKIAEGEIRGGELTGPWVFFYKSGKARKEIECVMVDSAFEGEAKHWHPNGKRKLDATYRAGRPHGRCVSYYSNGMISAEGAMVDGKRDGVWQEYKWGDPTPATVVYEAGALVSASPAK